MLFESWQTKQHAVQSCHTLRIPCIQAWLATYGGKHDSVLFSSYILSVIAEINLRLFSTTVQLWFQIVGLCG